MTFLPNPLFIAGLGLLVLLEGCSSSSPQQVRTDALQNRQGRMNDRAENAADRRQIRSDTMDARTAATFDAL